MLYYKIFTESKKNASKTFSTVFGKKEDRKNKILLAALRDKNFPYRYEVQTPTDIYTKVLCLMQVTVSENAIIFYSDNYVLDNNGLCEDGDTTSIRYARRDNGKIYKMKAGKFFRKLLAEKNTNLCEQIAAYCAEEFARRWEVFAAANIEEHYELHVDENFEDIYSYECCGDNFGSCMTGKNLYTFFERSIAAHAAYLTNEDNIIVARCILYDEVRDDESGKTLRLAERQYAENGDEKLKRMLVDYLIKGGYIDGYKAVGAGCGEKTAFIPIDGVEFNKNRLSIHCNLDDGDTLSYQDTFKSYDYEEKRAYNYCAGDYELDTTEGVFCLDNHDDEFYSEYHDEYIADCYAIFVDTRNDYFYNDEVVEGNVRRLNGSYNTEYLFQEDAILCTDGEYYYAGEDACEPECFGIYQCEHCGEYFTDRNGEYYHSEMLDEYFCCKDCVIEEEGKQIGYYEDEWVWTEDGARRKEDCVEAWYYNSFEGQWKTEYVEYGSYAYKVVDGFNVFTFHITHFREMLSQLAA